MTLASIYEKKNAAANQVENRHRGTWEYVKQEFNDNNANILFKIYL